jgi:prepilin-type N-terminal cleavage/methylation domain-containing protein
MTARPNGFTLLELLAAVAILGLLLVILSQGVHFGLLATQTEARIGGENAGLQEIDLALRHLIEATDPGSDEQEQPSLLGRRNMMTLITKLPGRTELQGDQRDTGPVEATLFVDGQHRLMLRWHPLQSASRLERPQPVNETELQCCVSRMELSFWQPTAGWVGGWQSLELPAMVRIHLVLSNRRLRTWPDIVVAPRLDRR